MRVALIVGLVFWITSVAWAEPTRQGGGESNLDAGVFIVDCDTGEKIIGGMKFTFVNVNAGYSYRISAIGLDGFDPVMAVITEPGIGSCNDDFPDVAGSQVAVPDLGLIEADSLSAQVTVTTRRSGNIDVLVGGHEGVTGQFAMVIEGLSIEPRTEADGFLVSVPEIIQSNLMSIYMISRDDSSLDAYLEAYYGEGLQGDTLDFDNAERFAWCDDVGSAECPGTAPFPGGGVLINNGYRYEAGFVDAGLGVIPETTDRLLYVFSSSDSRSSGEYGILVIGTAPGELGEGTTSVETPAPIAGGCVPVPMHVSFVSDEFDSRYTAEMLLDDDPSTGWSSKGNSGSHYVHFIFNQPYNFNRLLFNSYPSSGSTYKDDAIKDFYVTVPNLFGDGEVTILEATAGLSTGYQIYDFDPVNSDQLYIEFTSNYGGDYFEASDIVVCQGFD